MVKKMAVAMAMLAASVVAQAETVKYTFNWTGGSGYTMSGNFSFDSASAADGAIRDKEVSSLFFEGFRNGASIGSTSNANTLAGFNFNFNSLTGQFFLNGQSSGFSGQLWNFGSNGLGFGAGTFASQFTLNGGSIINSVARNSVLLTATLVPSNNTVPEPASLALVGFGIVGLAAARRKARK